MGEPEGCLWCEQRVGEGVRFGGRRLHERCMRRSGLEQALRGPAPDDAFLRDWAGGDNPDVGEAAEALARAATLCPPAFAADLLGMCAANLDDEDIDELKVGAFLAAARAVRLHGGGTREPPTALVALLVNLALVPMVQRVALPFQSLEPAALPPEDGPEEAWTPDQRRAFAEGGRDLGVALLALLGEVRRGEPPGAEEALGALEGFLRSIVEHADASIAAPARGDPAPGHDAPEPGGPHDEDADAEADCPIAEAREFGGRPEERRVALARLRQDPRDAHACAHLARLAAQAEQWGPAVRYARRALALGERDEAMKEALAFAEEALHDTTERTWGPGDLDELAGKAEQAREEGLPGLARFLAAQARRLAPESAQRWRAEGAVAELQEDFGDAERCYAEALARGEEDARPRLAFVLMRQERWAEAAEAYRALLETHRQVPPVWYNLGVCLQAMGDADGALANWERALAIHPGYAMAWAAKSQALHLRGQREEAQQCWERAVNLDPAYATAVWRHKISAKRGPLTFISGIRGPPDKP